MVSSVTVHASNNSTVTLEFDATSNAALAQQVAGLLSAGIDAGTVVTAFDTDGPPPVLPSTVSGAFVQTQLPIFNLPPGYSSDLVTKPGSAVVYGSGANNETTLS